MTIQKMELRRLLIFIGVLVIAGLLAFPLRETIYEAVVVPIAFIAWNLDLFYRSYSQGIWWWVIVLIVVVMLVWSLLPRTQFVHRTEAKAGPRVGQVENLARSLERAERGIYFKWLVANRLGKLAYQILIHRESGRPRSIFAPLIGSDWEPSRELQAYLESGLQRSFADFPHKPRGGAQQKTALDLDVAEAVEFLEVQMENDHQS